MGEQMEMFAPPRRLTACGHEDGDAGRQAAASAWERAEGAYFARRRSDPWVKLPREAEGILAAVKRVQAFARCVRCGHYREAPHATA